ncbi:MAG: flagellar protein FlaG [Pseudomonadota bacterium]
MKIEEITQSSVRGRHMERPSSSPPRPSNIHPDSAGLQASAETELSPSRVVPQNARAKAPASTEDALRTPQATEQDAQPTRAAFEALAKDLEVQVQVHGYSAVTFEVSSDEPPVMVLRDTQSGEELKRIPPETMHKLHEAFKDLKGLLVDEKG